MENSGKSRIVFAILSWFLGAFGAQYWYIGNTKAALINIAIYWLTCGIGGILNLVIFIKALLMSDEEFEAKVVNNTTSVLPM